MPVFDIFASPRWSPLRMRTKVVSFFIFFQELSNKKKIKALRPKMTKIASRGGGSCLKGFHESYPGRLSDSKSPCACHNTTVPWLCMVILDNLPLTRHAKALHGHTWQPATDSPRQGFAIAWSCLAICQIAMPWRHRFAIRQLATNSGQTDRHTHTHTHTLINVGGSPPGPYGPGLGQ